MIKIKEAIEKYNNDRRVRDPKMTMKRLGQIIGIDPWYISRWSKGHNLGKLTPDILSAICVVLKTDPNYIYGYTDQPPSGKI